MNTSHFWTLTLFIKKKRCGKKHACIFNGQSASLSLFNAILQIMVCFIHAKCYNKYNESIPKLEYEKEHSSKSWQMGRAWEETEINLTEYVRNTGKNNARGGY